MGKAIWHKNVRTMALLAAIKGFKMLRKMSETRWCVPGCMCAQNLVFQIIVEFQAAFSKVHIMQLDHIRFAKSPFYF